MSHPDPLADEAIPEGSEVYHDIIHIRMVPDGPQIRRQV
jgi:hypothetical protein